MKEQNAQSLPPPPSKVAQLKHKSILPAEGNRADGSGLDDKSLKELAASITEHGIIQPLTVRTHPSKPDKFELICGERRWRAAGLAKLEEVPCIIRECSDVHAVELRAIENLQREGISELEEAKNYAALLEILDPATKAPVHTVETIAVRIGKSAAFVYARLKLLKMPEIAQIALMHGKLTPSVALMICRIPDPVLARKAALEVLTGYGNNTNEEAALDMEQDAMSVRAAKAHIQGKYMVRLKGAPFDQEDANLLPTHSVITDGTQTIEVDLLARKPTTPGACYAADGHEGWHVWDGTVPTGTGTSRQLLGPISKKVAELFVAMAKNLTIFTVTSTSAGPCSTCPHRTGNMKSIFPDAESADVCTNPTCFKAKKTAHEKAETLRFKDKGQKLLTPTKANQILEYGGGEVSPRSGYIDLRARVPGTKKTWEDAIGDHLPKDFTPEVARGKKNFLVAPAEVVAQAAKDAGLKVDVKVTEKQVDYAAQQAERDANKVKALKLAEVAGTEVLVAVKKDKSTKPFLQLLAGRVMVESYAGHHEIKGGEAGLTKHLKGLGEDELRCAIVECLFFNRPVSYQGELEPEFVEVCEHYGVDLKALAKEQKAAAKDVKLEIPKAKK